MIPYFEKENENVIFANKNNDSNSNSPKQSNENIPIKNSNIENNTVLCNDSPIQGISTFEENKNIMRRQGLTFRDNENNTDTELTLEMVDNMQLDDDFLSQ